MVAYSSILPPNSLGELVRPIVEMSATEFGILNAAASGPRSFSLKKDEIEKLRSQLPPSAAKNLTFLLTSLSFLYSHIARQVDAGMPYAVAINATVDEIQEDTGWGEKTNEKRKVALDRFSVLFRPETHQHLRKIQRLQTGFLPNALGFASFVDLRPDFGDSPEIIQLQGYIPLVQFRITTDSSVSNEKTFVFQLNEETLADLKRAVERVEEKLSTLKERSPLAPQIIKGQS
jgi:hypothetical protein